MTLCGSCNDIPPDVQSVLNSTGDQKSDLKEVITHYKKNIGDSLKLKATYFLIRNMKHHYTINGRDADLYALIYRQMAAVLVDKRNNVYKEYIDSIGLENDFRIVYDMEGIKAKDLIENIDNAFKVWKNSAWGHNYNFEMFCEFILPYRVSTERYFPWRETYYAKYQKIFDNINFVAGKVYQADSALLKNCEVKIVFAASNKKGVKMSALAKSSLEIKNIMRFSERRKTLLVRYFNGGQQAEQQLIVNDKHVATLQFPETGNWEKPAVNPLKISISLDFDVNSIKLLSTKNQVVLDELEVIEAIDYASSIDNNIESGSIYKIRNAANGTVFTIENNGLEKGIPLISKENKNEPGQGFKIVYNNFGFYKIVPNHVKGKLLDLFNFSRLNGGEVKMEITKSGQLCLLEIIIIKLSATIVVNAWKSIKQSPIKDLRLFKMTIKAMKDKNGDLN